MPIIGTIDSAKSGNLYAASYDSIASYTVGAGGVASVEFSSIPNTYTHLQLRYLSGDGRTGADSPINLRFNSDSGTNYSYHELGGDGSTAQSYGTASDNKIWIWAGGQNTFGAGVVDILDYTSTTKFKTVRNLAGQDSNFTSSYEGWIRLASGIWRNSSITAISTITLTPLTGNFRQYSSFALYGMKVA